MSDLSVHLTWLFVAVGITVAGLVGVVITGIKARRHAHYTLVAFTLAALCGAIWLAETLGAKLTFEGTAKTVHTLHFIAVGLSCLALPIAAVTGVRLARATPETEAGRRVWHRKIAWITVISLVLTTALGTAMTLMALP